MSKELWRVDLICCDREDGHIVRGSWSEANQFRLDYCSGYAVSPYGNDGPGHKRAGILVQDHAHTGFCNGYTDGCPLKGGSFLDAPMTPTEPTGEKE